MSGRIFKSTALVGSTTLISRITGLARDMVYSQMIPVGALDAFLVAYKIPNFLRRLFAEGSFSQSFVPVISEYKVKRSHEEVRELIDGVAGTFGAVLFLVTLAGVIAAPLIILAFAPGWHGEEDKFQLAVAMLRWTFPYLLFISLTAAFSGVLNSYGRFVVPAITQAVMNVVMIVFAIWIAPHTSSPGVTLAMGVFVSGVLQLFFQLPVVMKLGLFRLPRWRPAAEGVRRIGKLMLPGIVGSSTAQLSLLLDTQIASFMVSGSIAWLYLADRIMEFPLGVFSIALATVILPGLSRHHAQASPEQFTGTLDWALRLVILLVSPASVAMLAFAGPLTATIFGYGAFRAHDTQMASFALMAYSWGLLGFSLVKVLAPGYFARQDTRTPVRVGLIALGVNIALNLAVVLPAQHFGFPYPHVLLATSTCTSAAVNTALLWRGLVKQGVYKPRPGWAALLGRIVFANTAMAGLLIWMAGDIGGWLELSPLHRAARLAACIVAAAAAYFAALWISGVRVAQMRGSHA
ncbi:MAG TPA: murein biosynthesis integral membrane protein MurJ [Steroidobacteraceae bacterium]|nr:murein biosynthesis integral membrane protein MurJ [Steroidobacteraceae bacterium]